MGRFDDFHFDVASQIMAVMSVHMYLLEKNAHIWDATCILLIGGMQSHLIGALSLSHLKKMTYLCFNVSCVLIG